ncbi:MAG: ISAs1 family transposase [Chloroflexota bacterium]
MAPELLGSVDLRGVVVTGDALYSQRELCRQIVDSGGEYLLVVKDNQPTLREEIATLFADPPVEPSVVVQRNRHGGRREVRRLEASSALNEYSDWPHLAQVCRIEREVTCKGEVTREVAYLVSSLWPHEAGPRRLLELNRGHWGIENRLHYVRDVTLGEDASQVRSGSAPQVMAALRNTAIGLMRQNGVRNVAEALRRNAAHPEEAIALLGLNYRCH